MPYVEPEFSMFHPDPLQNSFIQGKLPWLIIISYLMFVKVFGPIIMKYKRPLDLKMVILTYNFVMVALNVVLCYNASLHLLELWPYRCDLQKRPIYLGQKKYFMVAWYFEFVKFAELLDTVFFILRKKFNQVSFLHVFHHAIMCALLTASMKYDIYSYYYAVVGSVNAGVHILMYLYYGLSILRPDVMKKYFWCKKYLTTLQIMQFGLFIVFMLYSKFIDCGFDFWGLDSLNFLCLITITVLFLNFYFRAYK